MRRIAVRFVIPALLPFLIGTAALAGGWAIVTVRDLPEYAAPGTPVNLTFTVRQHGINRLSGLKPGVRATAPGHPDVRSSAAPTANSGEYTATLVFPQPASWTIRIDTGFNANAATLLPLTVIDAAGAPPAPLSPAERGEQLFVSKGCIGCHRHRQIAVATLVSAGPDLTGKRFPPDHLKDFLANPGRPLKRSATADYGRMPNLDLEVPEIAALAAFINRTGSFIKEE